MKEDEYGRKTGKRKREFLAYRRFRFFKKDESKRNYVCFVNDFQCWLY